MKAAYVLLAAMVWASHASAGEVDAKFFGHKVSVVGLKNDPDFWTQGLQIDGKMVVRKGFITIDEILVHDGVPVMIGYAAPGGNACDSAPFVVSFPLDETPRVDGPVDTCSAPAYKITGEEIVFTTPSSAAGKGERWVWTLKDGFQAADVAPFKPKGDGWVSLRTKTLKHPASLFDFQDIGSQVEALAGPKMPELRTILFGPGSGSFQGDTFIGTACQPHNCTETGSLLIVDVPTRQIYVAWKPDGASIEVRPEVSKWPSAYRERLRDWAKVWVKADRAPRR